MLSKSTCRRALTQLRHRSKTLSNSSFVHSLNMNTPEKISCEEFLRQRQAFIDRCDKQGEAVLCPVCRSWIRFVGAYLSIHDARLENCAGYGKVLRLVVPYCPQCETQPSDRGCLHELPIGPSTIAPAFN